MLSDIAWVATGVILFTYAKTVRSHKWTPRFHIANAVGCIPLTILNAEAGVWQAVVVNLGFGIPAWWFTIGYAADRWYER